MVVSRSRVNHKIEETIMDFFLVFSFKILNAKSSCYLHVFSLSCGVDLFSVGCKRSNL